MPYCIKCGREVDLLIDGRLCRECYLEVYGLGSAPKALKLTICPRCGSFLYEGRWIPGGSLNDVVRLTVSAKFKPTEHVEYYSVDSVAIISDKYHGDYAVVRVLGKFKGDSKSVLKEYAVKLRLEKKLCPSCFRKAAKSYTAIIQIRGFEGELTEDSKLAVLKFLEELPNDVREAIVEIEELREGLDLRLLDQGIARSIAVKLKNTFAAKIIESHKVVGRRSDGKRVSRLTLSVRLPFFYKSGVLAELDGELAVVESISRGLVYVRKLGSKRRHKLTVDEAWRKLKQVQIDEAHIVQVVAETPSEIHVQLLGENYDYLELRKGAVIIEGRLQPGAQMLLVYHRGKVYLLGAEYAEGLLGG